MKIGNIIINTSKKIRRKIIQHPDFIEQNNYDFIRLSQIYSCRLFGLCIYRTESVYVNETREIKYDALKLNDDVIH
jgi:hypothetical protein